MKKMLFIVLFCMILPVWACAQFTVRPDVQGVELAKPVLKDTLPISPLMLGSLDYTTREMHRYERKRQRHERNTIEINPKLSLSQANFANWAQGGDDMFNGNVTLYLKYQYKSSRFTLTNTFDGGLGLDIIDTIRFKSLDKFDIHSQAQWGINDHWSYSGDLRLTSQFLKGYKSRKDETYVSDFLSPAKLVVSLGFTYKPFLKENLEMTISPLAGQAIIVTSDSLSRMGVGGIDKGRHFQPTIGPQFALKYEKSLWKDLLKYRTDFTSFYNFEYSPNVTWNNRLSLHPMKFLSIDYNWFVIYDEGIRTKDMTGWMQYSAKLLISLSFTFKNK